MLKIENLNFSYGDLRVLWDVDLEVKAGEIVTVVGAKVGPSVTQYQVEPGFVEKAGPDGASKQWKVRVSQISSLADDLALALAARV